MKMRLAVILPDDRAGVIRLTAELRTAVNTGDMDGVDAATEKLMAVTATARSVYITEEEWRRFLAEVRGRNAAFQSDYLVPGELCSRYFPGAMADTMVLQLPVDEREAKDV